MQRLKLKHNWLGVYHRSYLDISFDFQVLNVILNKIGLHSPPLCDTERLYLPPNAIQAYCCSSGELYKLGHSLRPESIMASRRRRNEACFLLFAAQARHFLGLFEFILTLFWKHLRLTVADHDLCAGRWAAADIIRSQESWGRFLDLGSLPSLLADRRQRLPREAMK